MSGTKYALVDVVDDCIIYTYNKDEFDFVVYSLLDTFFKQEGVLEPEDNLLDYTDFNRIKDSRAKLLDKFIEFYNERYSYSGGKHFYKTYPDELDYTEIINERPRTALAEVIKGNANLGYYTVSILTPELLYNNYPKDTLGLWLRLSMYNSQIYWRDNFKGKRGHYFSKPKPRNRGSLRNSNHFERWYAEQADVFFSKSVGEPPARRKDGLDYSGWGEWENEAQTHTGSWKDHKYRYQWQHNLDHKGKPSNVSKYNRKQLGKITEYWNSYHEGNPKSWSFRDNEDRVHLLRDLDTTKEGISNCY